MAERKTISDEDRRMARLFSGYIANFVKTDNPNGGDLPAWLRFDSSQFDLMTSRWTMVPYSDPIPDIRRWLVLGGIRQSPDSLTLGGTVC
jgi:carboxylesterase type B